MPIINSFLDNRPIVLRGDAYETRMLTAAQGDLVIGTVLGVVTATGNLRVCGIGNGDGSQVARMVLAQDAPNAAGTQNVRVLIAGMVDGDQLTFSGVETQFSVVAATNLTHRDSLRANGITAMHGDDLLAWDNT
ncbi:MAG TPA: head decoration protein [Coriobacteriia bacterium]|nr:head decoration protein [Coriobacteriia bacterium]